MKLKYLSVALEKSHNRRNFNSGNEQLDRYIQKQVSQDIKRKLCVCFVIINKEMELKGYYILSSNSIDLSKVPEELRKKMPRSYTNLPVTLLGRLAVVQKYKGEGYGKMLLIDSLKRSFDVSQKQIGSMAVIVDPIDESAIKFYEKFGFIKLSDSKKMFLPMNLVRKLFK